MDVSLLNNLLPMPTVQPANGALPQNVEGEEGAFQLLLENMLFQAVAGQVFKEGGGLLAGMDLGLFTEEGPEGQETNGQDLLALLEMLQGPLLDHFRQSQPQLGLVNGQPVTEGSETQVPLLPVIPEVEGKSPVGLQQANGHSPAGPGDNLNQNSIFEAQFQGLPNEEARPQLNNIAAKSSLGETNPIPEHHIKLGAQEANGSASPISNGLNEEQLLPEVTGGRDNSFINLLGDQNQRGMDPINQAGQLQQPRTAGSIGYSELAEQIIQSGKLKLLGDKQEMEIQLKPEYLGKLAIRLSLENGVLTARFLIENHQVARMVDSNLPQLKQTLEDQGVRFDQVQVEVGDPGSSFQERHQDWQQPRGNHLAPFTINGEESREDASDYPEHSSRGGIDYRA